MIYKEQILKEKHKKYMKKADDEDILFFAFRYALGRRTSAVSFMVDRILNRWNNITKDTKIQMQHEIREVFNRGIAGDPCDIEEWQKILDKKV